ncbi:LOW QUALITY PROTEIN: reverse transcriptase [Phytophthora megakarya]|uniref:Reverse transcriptase n=1 Tax=Phytophthora megakarya TaxID=4795 RepID=A0A225WXW8_9STRA|nr:LOW QUALITY PROTEIN: reverse transcriptase [Phytophthora megakarya]
MTLKIMGNSAVVMNTVTRDPEEPETHPEPVGEAHPDLHPEVETLEPESMANVENNAQVLGPGCAVTDELFDTGSRLEAEYDRVVRVSAEELDLEPAVYLREGSDLMAQLRDQLFMLPEIEELTPDTGGHNSRYGSQDEKDPETPSQHLSERWQRSSAPARGVVCDIDVGEAKPVALRARQIGAPFLVKVFELLKKFLEAEIIEHSESEWSSPIVIVLKQDGIDIRMCIDYRLMNLLIKLCRYPLPLIDDLLVDFKSAMWFMGLDMASGFWAVRMTERANLISAFVYPFGHFQWLGMPFKLKNAPLIYQSIINNCLWGFVRLPPEEEAKVDSEVLEFLNLEPQEALRPEICGTQRMDITVFRRNIPAPSQMGPFLGRISYIDDIAHGAPTWDQLCEDLDVLLYRLRYWNISSFLGSLTYYNKFIEAFPVVAAVLYELDKEHVCAGWNLEAAKESFEILKRKIVSTPLLRHPDMTKPFVIILHANPWAACAALDQALESLIHQVRFTGRVLKQSELRYHIAEKEVLAILRTLELLKSNTADGQQPTWGLELSRWTLEIHPTQKDEDGLAAILESGITLREHLDEVAETLIPAKGRLKVMPPGSLEMLEEDYQGYVPSFDGAAKVSTRRGSCRCIVWKLPGLQIVKAEGHILEGVTVNDADYHDLILGLKLAMKYAVKELVAVGDSRIVVQQAQGLINRNQPNLQRRLAEHEDLRKNFVSVKLIHVKREFNQAADYLTSNTIVLGESLELDDPDEIVRRRLVSRILEKTMKPSEIPSTPATDAVCSDRTKLGVENLMLGYQSL